MPPKSIVASAIRTIIRHSGHRKINALECRRLARRLEARLTVAEAAFRRFELGFEVLPIADRGAVERLPYLLGAGGAHRALRLVEIQAGTLERQPAVAEQASDRAIRILDQCLVLHVQYLARQHAIPMIHERQVAAIVAAEIFEVIAEGLSLGKILFVGA